MNSSKKFIFDPLFSFSQKSIYERYPKLHHIFSDIDRRLFLKEKWHQYCFWTEGSMEMRIATKKGCIGLFLVINAAESCETPNIHCVLEALNDSSFLDSLKRYSGEKIEELQGCGPYISFKEMYFSFVRKQIKPRQIKTKEDFFKKNLIVEDIESITL